MGWASDASYQVVGTPDVVSYHDSSQPQVFLNINDVTGATTWYNHGYWGWFSTTANVEAGHIWNGQESTSQVLDTSPGNSVSYYINDPSISPAAGQSRQYDWHATAVGFTIGGLGPPINYTDANGQPQQSYYYYQMGVAPRTTLWSGAIATSWNTVKSPDGNVTSSFEVTPETFTYAYSTAMESSKGWWKPWVPGWPIYTKGAADVINSSWGFDDPTGSQYYTVALDALAYQNHQTVCLAAGNDYTAPIGGMASGYNSIAVGATGTDTSHPAYGYKADFSSTGPNPFYNPQTGITIPNARAAVDIVAPGTDLYVAAYLGKTGSNYNGAYVDPNDPNQVDPMYLSMLDQLYFIGMAGTSFASPIVAGGAALICDAGHSDSRVYNNPNAVDGRVVKAVLLNSATKAYAWSNAQHTITDPTTGKLVVVTTQALDYQLGAGILNLDKAYYQYLSGTTDLPGITGGTIDGIGWDFGHVTDASPNTYFLRKEMLAGDNLTATLDWFVKRTYVYDTEYSTPDATTGALTPTIDPTDSCFDQLALELWRTDSMGNLLEMVAESIAPYENVQLLDVAVPTTGYYALRVRYFGTLYDLTDSLTHADDYALAWAVPEPATAALLLAAVPLLLRRRKR